ncbi:hypothetical protein AGMMS49543_09690 [Betaproteobacteria bacterium]|nr:hypothetical protein AGMMS49543_09690 [Betaproteobacteria bacterium]GHU16969.1 hypothetical protein AGMMS50243_04360 [Betaproteobacteria bacterium]
MVTVLLVVDAVLEPEFVWVKPPVTPPLTVAVSAMVTVLLVAEYVPTAGVVEPLDPPLP